MVKKQSLKQLKTRLKEYEAKISQLQKDWAESRADSRCGDEYLSIQIRVYQSMAARICDWIMEFGKEV